VRRLRVEEFLESSARRLPDTVALVCDDRRWTYAELDRQADGLAAAFRRLGVRRGDRVAVHLDNSAAAVVAIFATLKAGAVFVLVSPSTKAAKLGYILRDCQATALVADARRHQVLNEALAGPARLRAVVLTGTGPVIAMDRSDAVAWFDSLLNEQADGPRGPAGIDVDLAALVYTSGSTGVSKGVMLTHLNMCSAAASITSFLENTEDDVILNVLPLSFDYGLYQVLMAFRMGARVVLERAFTYPHTVLEALGQERATGFPIVPTIAALLLQLDLARYAFPDLRYITNTGAALPGAHISGLRAWLPHVRLYSMYGLTECKRVSFLPPEEIDRRPTSVGKAMPNIDVMLVDEAGAVLPPPAMGELVVRGSNVMEGYWNQPEETAAVLRPGRPPQERVLRSGDLFRTDEEGFLYFVGRRDDIIKCRGEKVSPREVENVLYSMPGVVEAAVVGEADEVLGHAVAAYIVRGEGSTLTEQDVIRHCGRHLEDVMIPRRVEFITAMPRTATGKIDRRALSGARVEN
jgi:long-chain acyl-CoA synthetase